MGIWISKYHVNNIINLKLNVAKCTYDVVCILLGQNGIRMAAEEYQVHFNDYFMMMIIKSGWCINELIGVIYT